LKIKCAVFDFDRTLVNLTDFVDWGRVRWLIIQTYLENGVPESLVKQHSQEHLLHFLNRIYEEVSRLFPRDKARKIQAAVYEAIEKCETEGILNAQLMPGCPEVLEWLKNRAVKIGIASFNSAKVVNETLKLRNLDSFFATVVARSIDHKMKPNPDQLLLCVEKMGCKTQNSVTVGDSSRDVKAAKRAGILAIGVSTGSSSTEELLAAGAHKTIRSLWELPEVLLTLDSSLLK